jgi:mannose-1-phosphate guanylyltransferase
VTAARYAAATRKELPDLPAGNIIREPCRRDTAAAVATACALVKKHGGDEAVGCVLASDHLISPASAFRRTLKDAVRAAAESEAIVTIGIPPTRPATGFGYIECAGRADMAAGTRFRHVARFVEKPDEKTALGYIRTGRFVWNSGMFIFRASVLEKAFAATAPDIGAIIPRVAAAKSVNGALKREYPALRRISFDFAVMEKTGGILVAESGFRWDDVGSWAAVAEHFPKDRHGNTVIGGAVFRNATNSIVVGSGSRRVAVVGLDGVIVAEHDGVTLVCARDCAEEVKKMLSEGALDLVKS